MASIRKTKLSPYWQAVLTLADGSRTNRSTRQTNERKAKAVADENYEGAAALRDEIKTISGATAKAAR